MTSTRSITVGILEDDEATRGYLEVELSREPDFRIVFSCGLLKDALAALSNQPPEIVLVDIRLPDGTGLDFVRAYRRQTNGRALILSVLGDRTTVLLAFECGASGYLLKDTPAEQIARDIRALVDGGTPISAKIATHLLAVLNASSQGRAKQQASPLLTARELEVLTMFSRGLSYAETAAALGLSSHTVADHVKSIYAKMEVHSRNEAVFEAVRNGWLEL